MFKNLKMRLFFFIVLSTICFCNSKVSGNYMCDTLVRASTSSFALSKFRYFKSFRELSKDNIASNGIFHNSDSTYGFRQRRFYSTSLYGTDNEFLGRLLVPNKLTSGDKIAAISLSWGGANIFPHRYAKGKQRLEEVFGLTVLPTKHALCDPEWLYKNPKARAEDLMEAFSDPNIKGIFSIIGGEESIRLLPYIDYDLIRANSKVFLGHSDATISHFMCLKAGIKSFYGTDVMTGFAENVEMHRYTVEGLKRTLFSKNSIGDIPLNEEGWTSEHLSWKEPKNEFVRRPLNRMSPWRFIGANQNAQGRLIGGCVEVLQFIIGTELWPELKNWKNTILFLELSEEGTPPIVLERMLRNLAAQKILESVNGILFSKPGGDKIKPENFVDYDQVILKVLSEYQIDNIPVVTNMDFGHTDPMWTLPYGSVAEIDVKHHKVRILESAVK